MSVEHAYTASAIEQINELCSSGELVHQEIAECKQEREVILSLANASGLEVTSMKELAKAEPENWEEMDPAQIFDRLEFQMQRIQRLSVALSISAHQSQSAVSELLQLIATGKSENATYSTMERDADYGGQIIDEAA